MLPSACEGKGAGFAYATQKPVSSVTVRVATDHVQALVRAQQDFSLHFGDFVITAVARALRDHARFNGNYGGAPASGINMSYLINLGKGTRIAVIRDAERLSVVDIAYAVKRLALNYLHDELAAEETIGGTFSITNVSAFGAYLASPPILTEQSCMLSIASQFDDWQLREGAPVKVPSLHLTLAYDARVAGCQEALNFLNDVKRLLEGSAPCDWMRGD